MLITQSNPLVDSKISNRYSSSSALEDEFFYGINMGKADQAILFLREYGEVLKTPTKYGKPRREMFATIGRKVQVDEVVRIFTVS